MSNKVKHPQTGVEKTFFLEGERIRVRTMNPSETGTLQDEIFQLVNPKDGEAELERMLQQAVLEEGFELPKKQGRFFATPIPLVPGAKTFAVRPDGGEVLVATQEQWVRLDANFRQVGTLDYSDFSNFSYSPNGLLLALFGEELVVVVEADTGQVCWYAPCEASDVKFLWSPDSTLLHVHRPQTILQTWDVSTGRPRAKTDLRGYSNTDCGVSPSGKLVLVMAGEPVLLLEPTTHRRIRKGPIVGGSGKLVVFSGTSHTQIVWTYLEGDTLQTTVNAEGNFSDIESFRMMMEFQPDELAFLAEEEEIDSYTYSVRIDEPHAITNDQRMMFLSGTLNKERRGGFSSTGYSFGVVVDQQLQRPLLVADLGKLRINDAHFASYTKSWLFLAPEGLFVLPTKVVSETIHCNFHRGVKTPHPIFPTSIRPRFYQPLSHSMEGEELQSILGWIQQPQKEPSSPHDWEQMVPKSDELQVHPDAIGSDEEPEQQLQANRNAFEAASWLSEQPNEMFILLRKRILSLRKHTEVLEGKLYRHFIASEVRLLADLLERAGNQVKSPWVRTAEGSLSKVKQGLEEGSKLYDASFNSWSDASDSHDPDYDNAENLERILAWGGYGGTQSVVDRLRLLAEQISPADAFPQQQLWEGQLSTDWSIRMEGSSFGFLSGGRLKVGNVLQYLHKLETWLKEPNNLNSIKYNNTLHTWQNLVTRYGGTYLPLVFFHHVLVSMSFDDARACFELYAKCKLYYPFEAQSEGWDESFLGFVFKDDGKILYEPWEENEKLQRFLDQWRAT